MKKEIIARGLLGIPLGLAGGYLLSIFTSLIYAGGYYVPCVPQLVRAMGSEINGVMVQALLFGILGFGFAAGSVVWEIENWGILRQTGTYFFIASVLMLPVAYLTYWMEHSVKGFFIYFGIFAFIFGVIWVVQYEIEKRNVRKINDKLNQSRETDF